MSAQKKLPHLPHLSLEGKYVLLLQLCPVCGKPHGFDCWGEVVQDLPDAGVLKLKVREDARNPERWGLVETYQLEDALDWVIRDTQQALADEFMRLVRETEVNRRSCRRHKPHNASMAPLVKGPSKTTWAGPWRAQDATEGISPEDVQGGDQA